MLYVLPGARQGGGTTSWRGQLALALAVTVSVGPFGFLSTSGTVAPATSPAFVPAAVSPAAGCSAELPTPDASGTLTVVGGPLGPTARAGVVLELRFEVRMTVYLEPAGSLVSSTCETVTVNTTTASDGSFSAAPVAPADLCLPRTSSSQYCVSYSAPLAPVTVAPVAAPPAGYAFSSRPSSTGVGLAPSFVWELAYVTLDPSSTTLTVSTDAPTTIGAVGRMANGSVTDLSPTFRWAVTGSGWSIVGNSTGPSVVVDGAAGAALGTLTVTANATDGAAELEPPPVSTGLVAVRTSIVGAELLRTTLDTGIDEEVSVEGTGAAGYTYDVTVDPGLGVEHLVVPCASVAATGGLADLSCTGRYAYPDPGVAQPTATLSNGYSTAPWSFPEVTVAPAPLLVAGAAARAGYTAQPLDLSFAVANGTGSDPYGQGCLAPGVGAVVCLPGPGPSWSFDPAYASPGNYTATAWAVDATGANVSASTSVTIVPPPSLSPLSLRAANMTAGVPVEVSATVSGGVLPARLFWNVSGTAAPWAAATVDADGNVSTVYLPGAAGVVELTLTLVDGLGTVVRSNALFSVAPTPAVRVAPSAGPSPGTAIDGTPFSLTWTALDPSGNPVPTFEGTAEIVVRNGSSQPEAELSVPAIGPLPPLGNDTFDVAPSAWIGGLLNVTVVPVTNGTFTLELLGTSLPNPVAPATFVASPDSKDVRLFAPVFAVNHGRTNSTFWHLQDRFGNAAPDALLTVLERFGSAVTAEVVAATALPGGASGVWVNFTAPGSGAGTVEVVDGAGVTVLGPVDVPAVASPAGTAASVVAAVAAVPVGAAAVGVSAFVRRRRHREALGRSGEQALRSLAEGREKVVAHLKAGPRSVGEIEASWDPPPAPPELADWLASLVADGTLGASLGPDRVARFRLADGPGRLRVELDPAALEAALRRRDEDETVEPRYGD